MKKFLMCLSMLVLTLTCLTGCGSDSFYKTAQLQHYSDYLIYLNSTNETVLKEYEVSIESTANGKKTKHTAQVSVINDVTCVHLKTKAKESSEAYLVGDVMYISKDNQKIKADYSPIIMNSNEELESFRLLFKKILLTYSNVEAMKPSYFLSEVDYQIYPDMPIYRRDTDNIAEYRIKYSYETQNDNPSDNHKIYLEERIFFIYESGSHNFYSIEISKEDEATKTEEEISVTRSEESFSLPSFDNYTAA